MEQRIS